MTGRLTQGRAEGLGSAGALSVSQSGIDSSSPLFVHLWSVSILSSLSANWCSDKPEFFDLATRFVVIVREQ